MTTTQLREQFLPENLFADDTLTLVYSHFDRIVAGGAVPKTKALAIEAAEELASDYFLQRREMGIINIGGNGLIRADGVDYPMQKYDCLYLGRGTREILLCSENPEVPACFYLNSTPAHRACPTVHIPKDKAIQAALGSGTDCNERVIYKYILPGNAESCHLVMGLTILAEGSVWNTMPCGQTKNAARKFWRASPPGAGGRPPTWAAPACFWPVPPATMSTALRSP